MTNFQKNEDDFLNALDALWDVYDELTEDIPENDEVYASEELEDLQKQNKDK